MTRVSENTRLIPEMDRVMGSGHEHDSCHSISIPSLALCLLVYVYALFHLIACTKAAAQDDDDDVEGRQGSLETKEKQQEKKREQKKKRREKKSQLGRESGAGIMIARPNRSGRSGVRQSNDSNSHSNSLLLCMH